MVDAVPLEKKWDQRVPIRGNEIQVRSNLWNWTAVHLLNSPGTPCELFYSRPGPLQWVPENSCALPEPYQTARYDYKVLRLYISLNIVQHAPKNKSYFFFQSSQLGKPNIYPGIAVSWNHFKAPAGHSIESMGLILQSLCFYMEALWTQLFGIFNISDITWNTRYFKTPCQVRVSDTYGR